MKMLLYILATMSSSVFAADKADEAQARLINCIQTAQRQGAQVANSCKDEWVEAMVEERAVQTGKTLSTPTGYGSGGAG